jgi:hypothetical protein
MQRFYNWPAPPGRALLAHIEALSEGDTLAVPNLAVFGSEAMRQSVLKTLLLRGISLKVRNVEPELEAELAAWRQDFRRSRVAVAYERGSYDHGGRKRSVEREPIRKLLAKGLTAFEIARKLDMPTSTVYRIKDELRRDEVKAAAR